MHDEMITSRSIRLKKIRIVIFSFVMLASFLLVVARLFTVQVLDYKKYTEYSKGQYLQKVNFSPTRGRILDRNMATLAMSVPMKSVFVLPPMVENKQMVAAILAKDLDLDREQLLSRLEKKGHFAWVKRKIRDDEYETLKARKLRGVNFVPEDKRFYPLKGVASHALGFCGLDNSGLAGLEYLYDKTLSGQQVTIIAQRDAMGKIYGYGEKPPDSNYEVVSTLDLNTQFAAEKAVRTAYARYKPKSAIAIVMDVKNGELLALAEAPEMDSNNYLAYSESSQKALSVGQSYEPGSTFKIFIAAAALDAGLTNMDERFNCENGRYEIGGRSFKEARNMKYGFMPLKDVIAKSSNIGMIKVAQKLGEKRMYDYMRRFGFGEKTGVDLPGEIPGLLRDFTLWSQFSMPSMSFGQEINVTPMQLVTALSMIGNGGMSVKPHLLKKVIKNGAVVMEYAPPLPKRVISESAAEEMIEMMRYTVTNGTGKLAGIKGYDVAGKTGTAQKFDNERGTYIADRAIASFAALFPADNPLYAVLVMLDEPLGQGWGGEVAAPIAKAIIEEIARQNGIPAATQRKYDVDWKNFRAASLIGPETEHAK
jgi:cell division protein FtsI (penicillin-binding protein 3)